MVGRPSSELPTFSLDWLCWQCQQFSIKKVVFEEVRRQYLIFEAEYASDFVLLTLSIKNIAKGTTDPGVDYFNHLLWFGLVGSI